MNWRHTFVFLRGLDVATTMALFYGPGAVEMNPLMRYLLNAHAVWFVVVQFLGAIGMIAMLNNVIAWYPKQGKIMAVVVMGLSGLVVLGNVIGMVGYYYYAWGAI